MTKETKERMIYGQARIRAAISFQIPCPYCGDPIIEFIENWTECIMVDSADCEECGTHVVFHFKDAPRGAREKLSQVFHQFEVSVDWFNKLPWEIKFFLPTDPTNENP